MGLESLLDELVHDQRRFNTSEDPGEWFSLLDFARANDEAESLRDWIADLSKLSVGESVTWDHGCSGSQTLTRKR